MPLTVREILDEQIAKKLVMPSRDHRSN